MSGFIAMDRDALNHPLLKDGERFRAWFWLLSKACWKPTPFDIGGKIITLERGQICASRAQLADAWGWSPSAVERFLTRLETEQMIGRATGQGRTVITITNYSKYQDVASEAGQASEQPTGQRPDSDRTTKEPLNQETSLERLEPNGSCASGDALLAERVTLDEVREMWNDRLAPGLGKAPIRKLDGSRLQTVKARIAEHDLHEWLEVVGNVERSKFLRGETGWHGFSFDWLIKKANFQKVLEGNYNG